MSARNTICRVLFLGTSLLLPMMSASGAPVTPVDSNTVARELGWVTSNENNCGGYYLEQPFVYPANAGHSKTIGITGTQALFSQHGTTVLEGKVSLTRFGQQMTADKAFLYRDQTNGKLTTLDLLGDVHMREPNTLVIAKRGHYNLENKNKTLADILYRTTLKNGKEIAGPTVDHETIQHERKVTDLTAWGKADEFIQNESKVYE